jgi:hypothetical protein
MLATSQATEDHPLHRHSTRKEDTVKWQDLRTPEHERQEHAAKSFFRRVKDRRKDGLAHHILLLESMAGIWARLGDYEKAAELYQKMTMVRRELAEAEKGEQPV